MGRVFTEEQVEFVKKNQEGRYNQELADMVNAKFGTSYKASQISNLKKRNKIGSGFDGRFVSGQEPFNKGKKQCDYMSAESIEKTKATRFKKGIIPPNTQPIGTETLDGDGYIYVKVDDKPNGGKKVNWKAKHKLIYEQHFGEVPKGYYVIFADGDKRNFEPSNLVIVTPAELLYLNQHKMIYKYSDLTKSSVLVARLDTTIRKKRKEN